MTPRASILTTCHNDGATLGSALLSAMGQWDRDIEIVVAVHGSTDESAAVALFAKESRDSRFVALIDDQLMTQPQALNYAAGYAKGEWLIVLNADDMLSEDAVEAILGIARTNPDVNLIYSPWQWIGHASGIYDFPPYTGDERMLTEHQIPGIRAVRRDLWDALGGEDESIAVGADWDWAVRGAARGLLRPYKHPTPLWLVRDHGPNVRRLSSQCDHKALRAHMARHFDTVDAEC